MKTGIKRAGLALAWLYPMGVSLTLADIRPA